MKTEDIKIDHWVWVSNPEVRKGRVVDIVRIPVGESKLILLHLDLLPGCVGHHIKIKDRKGSEVHVNTYLAHDVFPSEEEAERDFLLVKGEAIIYYFMNMTESLYGKECPEADYTRQSFATLYQTNLKKIFEAYHETLH